jgi:hypothetical protein
MKLPAIILLILTAFLASCYGAQQTINIGTTPSDGTGDTLRTAFGKVNTNFTELYSLTSAINASNISTGTLPIARIADSSVTNAKLLNSAITINGSAVSLGGTIDIVTSSTLTGLTDVTITSAATNDFLVKSAGDWVNLTPASARTALGLSSAGGVLSGNYPNPGFAVDMVEQSELTTALSALNATNLTSGTLPIARVADASVTLAKLGSLTLQAETLSYYKAVLAAGSDMSAQVLMAYDDAVHDIKAANLWSLIHEWWPHSGNSLVGALVKMKAGTGAPSSLINNGFTSANYSQRGGFGIASGNSSFWTQSGFIPSAASLTQANIGMTVVVCNDNVTLGAGSGRTIGDMQTGNAGECGIWHFHSNSNMAMGNATYSHQTLNRACRVMSYNSSATLHHTCADGVQYSNWTQNTSGTLTGEITGWRVTRFSANRFDNGVVGDVLIHAYMTPAQAKALTSILYRLSCRIRAAYQVLPVLVFDGDSIGAEQSSNPNGAASIMARRLGYRLQNHSVQAAWLTATTGPSSILSHAADIVTGDAPAVIVWPGANDVQYSVTGATFQTSIDSYISTVQNARRRLLVCSPNYSQVGANQTTLRDYASRMAGVAVSYGVAFADCNIMIPDAIAAGTSVGTLMADNVHPTAAGQALDAEAMWHAWHGRQIRRPYLNPGAISAGATASVTITVLTARAGDPVQITPPSGLDDGLICSAAVSANDTVTLKIRNTTGGSITPAAAAWTIIVFRPS